MKVEAKDWLAGTNEHRVWMHLAKFKTKQNYFRMSERHHASVLETKPRVHGKKKAKLFNS